MTSHDVVTSFIQKLLFTPPHTHAPHPHTHMHPHLCLLTHILTLPCLTPSLPYPQPTHTILPPPHSHTLTPTLSTFPQARAPHSPVIIVGTHLDKISSKSQKMELTQSLEYIAATYGTEEKRREGFPQVRGVFPSSYRAR